MSIIIFEKKSQIKQQVQGSQSIPRLSSSSSSDASRLSAAEAADNDEEGEEEDDKEGGAVGDEAPDWEDT
jgi:hypothetical protein